MDYCAVRVEARRGGVLYSALFWLGLLSVVAQIYEDASKGLSWTGGRGAF